MLGSQVVANGDAWPLNTVPYSQSQTNSPTGHRQDCSGFASMCLGLPTPGESTVTLVTRGLVREITPAELQPGDLVGKLGEGTWGDAGHVQVFVSRSGTYGVKVLEQAIGSTGPDLTVYKAIPAGYKCYRYVGIDEDELSEDIQKMIKDLHYYFFEDAGPRRTGTAAADLIGDMHFATFVDAGDNRPEGSLAALPGAAREG